MHGCSLHNSLCLFVALKYLFKYLVTKNYLGDSHPSLQFFAEKKGKVYLAVPFLTMESRCWTDTSRGGSKGLLHPQLLSGQVTITDLSEVCVVKSFAACKSASRKKRYHLFTFL